MLQLHEIDFSRAIDKKQIFVRKIGILHVNFFQNKINNLVINPYWKDNCPYIYIYLNYKYSHSFVS